METSKNKWQRMPEWCKKVITLLGMLVLLATLVIPVSVFLDNINPTYDSQLSQIIEDGVQNVGYAVAPSAEMSTLVEQCRSKKIFTIPVTGSDIYKTHTEFVVKCNKYRNVWSLKIINMQN